jgi:hypothetical protein
MLAGLLRDDVTVKNCWLLYKKVASSFIQSSIDDFIFLFCYLTLIRLALAKILFEY